MQGKVIIKDSLGYVQSIGHYVNGNMYFISTDKDTDYYIRNKSCFILEIFSSSNEQKFSFLPGVKDNLGNTSSSVYNGEVSNNAATYRCRARTSCDQYDYISASGSHCGNGGLCDEDDSGTVWCDCPAEFSGEQCELKIDDCVNVHTVGF